MLIIKFLGEVKIEYDNKDIGKNLSSKGKALLAILMLRENKRCSRNELRGLLWPENTEESAKYNLRYNLWQINKVIPHELSGESFLIVTREYCQINLRYQYWCDICEIAQADIAVLNDTKKLEYLKTLFVGDFFEDQYFSGCDAFEEIIIFQRYCLENKKLTLMKKLIANYYNLKQWEQCQRVLEMCEEMDPYDEENAVIQMQILMSTGKVGMATRYYHTFTTRLVHDMGIEPSEKLKKCIGNISYGKQDKEMDIPKISLKTAGVVAIEYYWMADVLKKLMLIDEFQITDYLSEDQISDLAYIQYRLGAHYNTPSAVRLVDIFVELIYNICNGARRLEIQIEDISTLDPVSFSALEILKKKCGSQLIVK